MSDCYNDSAKDMVVLPSSAKMCLTNSNTDSKTVCLTDLNTVTMHVILNAGNPNSPPIEVFAKCGNGI